LSDRAFAGCSAGYCASGRGGIRAWYVGAMRRRTFLYTAAALGAPAYFHWGDGPGVKNFTWWQSASKTALVIFTNGDHGASAYRYAFRRLLAIDPIAPEWV
jgi:hypothetical protein